MDLLRLDKQVAAVDLGSVQGCPTGLALVVCARGRAEGAPGLPTSLPSADDRFQNRVRLPDYILAKPAGRPVLQPAILAPVTTSIPQGQWRYGEVSESADTVGVQIGQQRRGEYADDGRIDSLAALRAVG
jgi:hypothetical protein